MNIADYFMNALQSPEGIAELLGRVTAYALLIVVPIILWRKSSKKKKKDTEQNK